MPDAVVQVGHAVEAQQGRWAAQWSGRGARMLVELAARAGCTCGAPTWAGCVGGAAARARCCSGANTWLGCSGGASHDAQMKK
jgi:hypothetical protein